MTEQTPNKLSRRDALKILAAVAGAGVLANIPGKWNKPGMEFGTLPAHAQTSVVGHTLAAGLSDDAANFCQPFTSTATITPVTLGIVMRYVIATTGIVTITLPATPTGTVPSDALGVASLGVTVNNQAFNAGDTVKVTWSFENASDGAGSGAQTFTSGNSGC